MDTVTLFTACALVLAPQDNAPCAPVPDPLRDARPAQHLTSLIDRWQPYIAEAARRFAIPQDWIRAVMRSESGGRTVLAGQPITSTAGAMGLMQLMPETYADMRQRYGLGTDSYDPHDNVLAGAAYLRLMYEQYGYPSLFAAYNAGPGRFDGYLLRGQSLPKATLDYIGSIVPGVETTMTQSANAAASAPTSGKMRTSNRSHTPPDRGLFFALNQRADTPNSPLDNREKSTRALRASATNGASQTDGLFIPLSQSNP